MGELERIRELLSYDRETGQLTWLKSFCPKIRAGTRAGSLEKSRRYVELRIDGKKYKAHRVAFLMETGRWPAFIDHINGDTSDNRMSNLRECTHAQNLQNMRVNPRSAAGVKGIRATEFGTFEVRIQKDWKRIQVGTFQTIDEAKASYNEAAVRLHQAFARLNP